MSTRILILAVLLGVLTGCARPWEGSTLDEFGWYACDDYAHEMLQAGGSAPARELDVAGRRAFVSGIAESAARSSNPEIDRAFQDLNRTVAWSEQTWAMGLDVFAGACLGNGWSAR